jgi:beta-lactamase superfamily II metal-dependent hydrolase
MEYEIDFLAVGEESKGGDAIALRYGNLAGPREQQTVIVIDGGYAETGKTLVEFIRTVYATSRVDIVLSTHPDRDHVTGLETVLEELTVGQLLMHQPWRHSTDLREARSRAFKTLAASERLQESLREASDLEQIAARRGVPIIEPFAGGGTRDGAFRILGPSPEYYEQLLVEIASSASTREGTKSLMASLVEKARELIVRETLERETLRDDGVTSPQNNASVISMLEIDGKKFLFTGDAGIPALEQAVARLEASGFEAGGLSFAQMPHHGSRRNVGPSVLDRLLGPKGQTQCHSTAYVSVPRKNPEHKHPAKKAENAFTRRGYAVHRTEGIALRHHSSGAPERSGYVPHAPIPFHDYVEEDSDA